MSKRTFLDAYVTCLLWSSTDDYGTPLDDNYEPDDFAPDAMATITADCGAFYDAHNHLWQGAGMSDEQAGHDYWLTRQRHGAGFWDRGIGEAGRELTMLAHAAGGVYTYTSEGKLHV